VDEINVKGKKHEQFLEHRSIAACNFVNDADIIQITRILSM